MGFDLAFALNPTTFAADLVVIGNRAIGQGQFVTDDTLMTAVVISLFTWRRANPDDVLPDPLSKNRMGWFGDWYSNAALNALAANDNAPLPIPTDRIGSRMWLLWREKVTPEVLVRAQEYCQEALQWMLDDGVASDVQVVAAETQPGVLGVAIQITKPDMTTETYRYDDYWQAAKQLAMAA